LERVCLFNIEDDPLQVGRNRAGELVYVDELSEVDEEEEDGSGSEDEGNKSMAGAIWFSTPKPTAPPPPKHWALLSRSTPATNTAFSSGANVCLDAVRLDDTTDPSNPSLSGAILVRNLAFSKRVLVRHTSDNWSTFYDLPATFAGTVVPTMAGFVGIDRFTFRLPVGQPPLTAPGALPPTREVVLAVSCTMDGREHWDNNAGANHAFHLGLREVMDHGRGRRKAEAVEELLRRARAGSEAALRAAVNSGQAMAVEARLIAEQFGREKKPWQVMTRGGAGGGGGVATGGHAQPQQVAPGYGGDEDGRRWSFSGLANDGGGSARDVGPVRAASFDRPVSADPPAMEKPRRPTSLPSMTAVDGFGGRKRGGGFTLKGTKGGLTKRLGNVDRSPSPPPVPFGGGWKGGFEGVGIGMMMKWGEKAEKGNK
ncbi:Protein phosphatase 1 regulatory subunit 3E, partial [Irineochytrium annulatum]